jgi:uncharacterized protein (TIGR02246 family)
MKFRALTFSLFLMLSVRGFAAPPAKQLPKGQPASIPAAAAPAVAAPAAAPAASDNFDSAPVIEPSADEKTVRENAAKYVEAYNRRDSATMASMWSPDAVYMDRDTGEEIVGRDALKENFDRELAGSEDAKLEIAIDAIDFVSPNVAIESGSAHMTYKDHDPEDTLYTAVHVKRDGQWLLDRISEQETPKPEPSNYEHLKELDWMVGSWVDSDDKVAIHTDCEWTKNQNFMTRSFAIANGDEINLSGMQIVGWDPVAKKIRSWVFDSNGGFGEGTWTKKDNRWIIQQTGVLPDGGKTSAVNIVTYVDNDSYKWQSTNREVDGEILPNIDEVLVVRKPIE